MKRTPMQRSTPLARTSSWQPGGRSPDERPQVRDGRHRPQSERLAGTKPERNPLPAAVREAVIDRDAGRCVRCSTTNGDVGWSVHHRKPRRMGGTRDPRIHALSNLVLLCGSGTTGCHGWVESNRAQALEQGWLLSSFTPDTAAIPIRFDDRLVWLHDDGTKTTEETQ